MPLSPLYVRFSNRKEYAEAVRKARLEELACRPLMSAVQCGLASVIPLQLISVLTPQDLNLRVCGKLSIDLEYLKVERDVGRAFKCDCAASIIQTLWSHPIKVTKEALSTALIGELVSI